MPLPSSNASEERLQASRTACIHSVPCDGVVLLADMGDDDVVLIAALAAHLTREHAMIDVLIVVGEGLVGKLALAQAVVARYFSATDTVSYMQGRTSERLYA